MLSTREGAISALLSTSSWPATTRSDLMLLRSEPSVSDISATRAMIPTRTMATAATPRAIHTKAAKTARALEAFERAPVRFEARDLEDAHARAEGVAARARSRVRGSTARRCVPRGAGYASCDCLRAASPIFLVLLRDVPGVPGGCSDLLRDPQLGAARTRIAFDLVRGRHDGLARDDPDYRHSSAHAHGQVGRARAAPRQFVEDGLDDPVLEGVVRDDRDPDSGSQPPDCGVDGAVEDLDLPVDLDAQRLEGPAGRVGPAASRRRRDRVLDHLDEFEGGDDGAAASRGYDECCDARGRRPIVTTFE